jgi:flagellar basal body-associated protein FliL
MDNTTQQTEGKGSVTTWLLIVVGMAVIAVGYYFFFRKPVHDQMKRVREGKAAKSALRSLTDKENVSEN